MATPIEAQDWTDDPRQHDRRIAYLVFAAFLLSCACEGVVGGRMVADTDTPPPGQTLPDAGPGEDPDWKDPEPIQVCEAPVTEQNGKRVRAVYLVPSDREVDESYLANIEDSIAHIQRWMHAQVTTGESIVFGRPLVEVVKTPHPASYYDSSPADGYGPAYYFWGNGLRDAFELTGGYFGDDNDVWLYFLDADQTCNTSVGSLNGVALFTSRHMQAVSGEALSPACGVEPDFSRCRFVGIIMSHLLTALKLPDAIACTDQNPGTVCADELATTWGHLQFPDALLSQDQVTFLRTSGWVRTAEVAECASSCEQALLPQ